jgi:hypothetical protein
MHVLVLLALLLTALALMIKCLLGLTVFLSGMIFVRRQQIQPVFRLYRDQDEWRLVAENAGNIDSSAKISALSQKPNHTNVVKAWCFGSKKRLSPIYLIVVSLIGTYFPYPWKLGSTYQIVSWSYCSQFLLIIRIETERNRLFYLPVMFDSCQPDEFRWLKVVVKYLL